ncbi:MAG: hypothetical protein H6625_13035 [Bdellovibrionaceae bacterium]|nr:hypothetical protein [Pseudobdellovibrionaceae bacterium]
MRIFISQVLLICTIQLGSSLVFGFDLEPVEGDSPTTLIDRADLICEDSGVKFAIRTAFQDEKVWQSDPGMDDGIELSINKFERMKCPSTYSIEATLTMFGSELVMTLETHSSCGLDGDITLDVYADGRLIKNVPCYIQ